MINTTASYDRVRMHVYMQLVFKELLQYGGIIQLDGIAVPNFLFRMK